MLNQVQGTLPKTAKISIQPQVLKKFGKYLGINIAIFALSENI